MPQKDSPLLTAASGTSGRFNTTHWSVVLEAQGPPAVAACGANVAPIANINNANPVARVVPATWLLPLLEAA